jgi:hypothetical protein|tara:strand:- start:482 stop:682 length:201 start_codon:yes stop_codon:yes gene_type:complete
MKHIIEELIALKHDLYTSCQKYEERIEWIIEESIKEKYTTADEIAKLVSKEKFPFQPYPIPGTKEK